MRTISAAVHTRTHAHTHAHAPGTDANLVAVVEYGRLDKRSHVRGHVRSITELVHLGEDVGKRLAM